MSTYTEKFNKAESLYNNGSYSEALSLFEQLWKEASDGDAALMFANCLRCLGRDDEAIRVYDYIIEFDPTWESPLYNLAGIYYKRKEYEKAKELYLKAAEADSTYADAWFKLGECCRMLDADNIEQAMPYYKKCIAITENNTYAHEACFFLGIAYLKLEKTDSAYKCLCKANELTPDDADTLHFLGLCCGRQNKLTEAIEYYKKALSAEERSDTHLNLALCYNDIGDKNSAIHHAKAALELDPDDADTLFFYRQFLGVSG